MNYDPFDIEIVKKSNRYKLKIQNKFIRTVDNLNDLEFINIIDAEALVDVLRVDGDFSLENQIITNSNVGWYIIHSAFQMINSYKYKKKILTKKFKKEFFELVFYDPIWRMQPGPESIEHIKRLTKVDAYLSKIGCKLIILEAAFMKKYESNKKDLPIEIYELFYEKYLALDNFKKAAWFYLYKNTKENLSLGYASVILPLLFINDELNINEYVDAELVVNRSLKSGWMDHYNDTSITQGDVAKEWRVIARNATTYVNTFGSRIQHLINLGESNNVEFKYALLYNPFTKKNDTKNKFNTLKTIVAFLSSFGGQLLIGVQDNGTIIGIENDGYGNKDKFELALKDMIKDHIGIDSFNYLKVQFEEINGKTVCLINCKKSKSKVSLLKNGKIECYNRLLNSSQKVPCT